MPGGDWVVRALAYPWPCWVAGYDPDFWPVGFVTFTPRLREALSFESHDDALGFYMQQCETRPVRLDGMPNLPLTHWSVVFERKVDVLTGSAYLP